MALGEPPQLRLLLSEIDMLATELHQLWDERSTHIAQAAPHHVAPDLYFRKQQRSLTSDLRRLYDRKRRLLAEENYD